VVPIAIQIYSNLGHAAGMFRVWALVACLACAPQGHWPPRPAEHPSTRAELAFYELTVKVPDPSERTAFARALAARGFNVVDHEPYKGQLEAALTHEITPWSPPCGAMAGS